MSVTTERTLRVVARVDLQAVIDEIVESDPAVVVELVETVVMEMGEDVRRALIDALNGIEFVEVEEPVTDDEDEEEPEL